MHIITDEHGNVCGHAHCHEHDEGHCHGQESHCHSHEGHCRDHNGGDAPANQNEALLQYMLDHNTHHAAELDQMAEKLAVDGLGNAAEQIRKAVDEFQKGNLYLGLALSLVKEK